jgi:hypothetical protein
LTWGGLWIAKLVLPPNEPLAFDQVLGGRREVLLHIPVETDCRGKHVAMLCDMANLFAGVTLYVGEEWASVAVRSGDRMAPRGAWSVGPATSIRMMRWGAPSISKVVVCTAWVAAVGVTFTNTGATGVVAITIGTVGSSKAIDQRQVRGGRWYALDDGPIGVNATEPWWGNITETVLGIEVDAFCKAVDMKVGREETGVVFLSVWVDVRLKSCNCIRVVGLLDSTKERAAAYAVGVVVL